MSVEAEDELARLRAQREAALRQQFDQQAAQQAQAEAEAEQSAREEETMLQAMRTLLTPEARERLARVALAHPETADEARRHLYKMHHDGQLASPVNDGTVKQVLARLQGERRERTIRRI